MRILIIRLSSLGDAVLATSAIEAVGRDAPGVEVDVLTKPEFAGVFERNPGVREVLLWREEDSPLDVARSLKDRRYDLIADLHANLRTRLLRLFLPGKWSRYRKGSAARRAAVLLGMKSLLDGAPHVTERYARALKPIGVIGPAKPKIYLDQDMESSALGLLREKGWDGSRAVVALAPGAKWPTNAWPRYKWKELARILAQEEDVYLALVGGRGERELCEEILAGARGGNFAGSTDVAGTAALLSRCRCLVTNDSAPLHIATAVATPAVALFGPTVKGFGFFPIGDGDRVIEKDIPCRPCSLHGGMRCPRGHFMCMEDISAEEVARAALFRDKGDG